MLKCLYRVIVDGREMFAVARNEDEVKKHCFAFFDYNDIKVYFLNYQDNDSEFPYIINREDFLYA